MYWTIELGVWIAGEEGLDRYRGEGLDVILVIGIQV